MILKAKNLLSLLKSKSSFFKENIWVIFTEYLWLFGVFIISVLYSRFYGADALGVFSYGTAISQIVILGLGSAFSNLIMRDVGTNSKLNEVYLKKVLQIRGVILLFTLFIVVVIQYAFFSVTNTENLVFILILIIAKGLDALCDTFYMVYLSLKIFKKYSYLKILHTGTTILFVTFSCLLHYPILITYLVMLLSSLFFLVFNIYFFIRQRNEMNNIESPMVNSNFKIKTPDTITFRYLAKEIWPLLLSAVFFQVGTRINTLIIFGFMGSISVGVYSSGLMLITCFTAAAPFMGIVLFPVLNRTFLENPDKLSKLILKAIPIIFMIGIAVMFVCYLGIPIAIKLMKNLPEYAVTIFTIMIWVIPFNYVIGIINSLFIIIQKQKAGMVVTFVVMVVNIILMYTGVLYFQMDGVAIAFVASSIFQVALYVIVYFYLNNRSLQIKPGV
jgi:O-antigen/teichoic acid export membrane protein